jgi:hypothetical protein
MFNKEAVPQTCKLDLQHINFDKNGQLSRVPSGTVPDNSAKPWFRYSPRNFTAAARAPQTVRFTLRRSAKMEPKEYRSYLEVYCENIAVEDALNKDNGNFAAEPLMVQNVPIIVRTGKLEAQVSFSDFRIENNLVHFNIQRQGNRSVHGKVELIDKETGEVINFRKNVSIYTETSSYPYRLEIPERQPSQLAVRFSEDKRYGGTINYQQEIVLK